MLQRVPFLILLFWSSSSISSQDFNNFPEDQFALYFELPRPLVHLHLNKSKFSSPDKIWFTAYLFEQTQGVPFEWERTLYCGLYDEDGNQLTEFSFLLENGIASGNIPIIQDLAPGIYLVKAYTNWMKNFKESVPFSQRIVVGSPLLQKNTENLDSIVITSEAQNLVLNTSNTIGFKIEGFNPKSPSIKEVRVVDKYGEEADSPVLTNDYGEGKFTLYYQENQTYYLKIRMESGAFLKKKLPPANPKGIAMSTNNFLKDKVVINLTTNKNSISDEDFFLVLHKDGALHWKKFSITQENTLISFPRENLSAGVNIITLMDKGLNPIAERMIFSELDLPEIKFDKIESKNDSIFVSARFNNLTANDLAKFSISIDHSETPKHDFYNSITSSFQFKPYINSNLPEDPDLYLNPGQLDITLFNEGWSNFKWNEIFYNPPVVNYKLQNGIRFQGEVLLDNEPQASKDIIFFKDNIMDFFIVQTDSLGKFTSEKILFNDEVFRVSILGEDETLIKPDLFIAFNPINQDPYDTFPTSDSISNKGYPEDSGQTLRGRTTEELEEVLITARKAAENRIATGAAYEKFKVTPELVKHNPLVTDLIRKAGFKVRRNGYNLIIGPKSPSNSPSGTPPKVYLNDFEIFDNSELINMPLSSIDEIYFEHIGAEGNKGGTIRIYEDVPKEDWNEENYKEIIVSNAYQNQEVFKSKKFKEKNSNDTFWIPQVKSKKGSFKFSFPKNDSKIYYLNIQGFSKNGRLISTMKELKFN
ncbi:hypothetical protein [Salegentibacter sp. Hel_I_6]|uniref:hypothetical protein n=1 Tax=Salegentibacter sp. Hel_I_6 TaxID=1250278 RepID=UPI000568E560|nr:hypothetical protein [Salegentibacter sp. Hel_I_6]